MVSFSTLGYGGWIETPHTWVGYLGGLESFVGLFITAMFLVTFSRKWTRGNGYLPPDDALNKDVPAPLELAAWSADLTVANSVSRTIRRGTGSVYKSKNAVHSSNSFTTYSAVTAPVLGHSLQIPVFWPLTSFHTCGV